MLLLFIIDLYSSVCPQPIISKDPHSLHPSISFHSLCYFCTDKKENQIFLTYKDIQDGVVASHIWLTASSYMGKYLLIRSPSSYVTLLISSYSMYIRSPSSYVTLQLLHSEFPFIWGKFHFLFYQCAMPTSHHTENIAARKHRERTKGYEAGATATCPRWGSEEGQVPPERTERLEYWPQAEFTKLICFRAVCTFQMRL